MSSDKAYFDHCADANIQWANSQRGRRITVRGGSLIKPDTKFFAMGSCFAVEIRKTLRALNCAVYPDYPSMVFDPPLASAGASA